MKRLDYEGYTMDAEAVNFIGKAEYSRGNGGEGSYCFRLIINGSVVWMGSSPNLGEAAEKRNHFLNLWEIALAEGIK